MGTIASLDVDLNLNSAKFVEGLKRVRKEHEDFAKSLKEIGEGANRISESLGIKVNADFSLGGMIEKAKESQESQAKLGAVLRATGNAAGFSAKGMERMSEEMARITTFSVEATRSAQTVLATFSSVRGDQFEGAVKAAADLATVFNLDLSTASEKLGRALENPAEGLRSLAKMGVQFSADQKAVIQSLIDVGETAKAQQEIIDAVNAKVGGASAAAANTAAGALRKLKNEYEELAATLGRVVLPAVATVGTAINGIAVGAKAISGALGQIKALAAEVGTMVKSLGSVAAVAAGLAVVAAFVESINEAYKGHVGLEENLGKAAEEAHRRAAEAARQHADALKALADVALDAAKKQHEANQALLSHVIDVRPQSERDEAAMQKTLDRINELRGLQRAGTATEDTHKELANLIQDYNDLPKKSAYERANEAAEEAASQQREMKSRADSIRDSIMTPMEKFQASLRELSSLVSKGALDPLSAGLAGRSALEALAKSNAAQQPVAAAALVQGSAAAYSAALRNDNQSTNNPLLDTAEKQLDQMLQDGATFQQILQALQQSDNQTDNTTVVTM